MENSSKKEILILTGIQAAFNLSIFTWIMRVTLINSYPKYNKTKKLFALSLCYFLIEPSNLALGKIIRNLDIRIDNKTKRLISIRIDYKLTLKDSPMIPKTNPENFSKKIFFFLLFFLHRSFPNFRSF